MNNGKGQSMPLAQAISERDPSAFIDLEQRLGEWTAEVAPEKIAQVCQWLKDEWQFERLSTLTAVDWPERDPRFDVVYHLHSIARNERLRLKCRVGGDAPEIDSVVSVWSGANWYEREVFDLFGIRFRNHPDLRRIMMPEDWQGYPLRKDYPLHGGRYDYAGK
ncbi:MAG: NADH-quinone oxidoreductase subunit C [Acidobacteriales bacterium]|nr:NADH-quinone oxidoreductase subunit C [Terriglobales bacterium]